jgi:hypothetical protein
MKWFTGTREIVFFGAPKNETVCSGALEHKTVRVPVNHFTQRGS